MKRLGMAKGSLRSFLISTPGLLCPPPVPLGDLRDQGARARSGLGAGVGAPRCSPGGHSLPCLPSHPPNSMCCTHRRSHLAAPGNREEAPGPGLPRGKGAGEARTLQPSNPPPLPYLGRRRLPSYRPRRGFGSQLSGNLLPGRAAPLSPPQPAPAGPALGDTEVAAARLELRLWAPPPPGRPPGSARAAGWGLGGREATSDCQGAWVLRAGLLLT